MIENQIWTNRNDALGPFILRMGLALILIIQGVRIFRASPGGDRPQNVQASDQGINLSLTWSGMFGGAAVLAGVAVMIGLLTRLWAFGMLIVTLMALWGSCEGNNPALMEHAAEAFPSTEGYFLILLVTVCLTLLATGSGEIGMDSKWGKSGKSSSKKSS